MTDGLVISKKHCVLFCYLLSPFTVFSNIYTVIDKKENGVIAEICYLWYSIILTFANLCILSSVGTPGKWL